MNRYIFIGLLCFVIGACTHHTTGFYEGPRYLSFVNEKGADTAFISFANYPGASTHEVAFVLKLTGNIPEEDLTYRLEVVDSLTTAGTTDYQLPEHLVFRKDRVTDTLVVTVMNSIVWHKVGMSRHKHSTFHTEYNHIKTNLQFIKKHKKHYYLHLPIYGYQIFKLYMKAIVNRFS